MLSNVLSYGMYCSYDMSCTVIVDAMMSALAALSDDPQNVVMVITGLTQAKLGDTFAGMKNLTLATSNGLIFSWGANMQAAHDEDILETMVTAGKDSSGKSSGNSGTAAIVDEQTGGTVSFHLITSQFVILYNTDIFNFVMLSLNLSLIALYTRLSA